MAARDQQQQQKQQAELERKHGYPGEGSTSGSDHPQQDKEQRRGDGLEGRDPSQVKDELGRGENR